MSAPSCLVFYGLRFTITPHELEAIEERADERVMRARKQRLDHYWGNFSDDAETWYLFIGKKIANVGPENGLSSQFSYEELARYFLETEKKLSDGGWNAAPRLFVDYQPDH